MKVHSGSNNITILNQESHMQNIQVIEYNTNKEEATTTSGSMNVIQFKHAKRYKYTSLER